MPWITPTVFKQGPGEALARVPRFDDGPTRLHFRHIVHAYRDRAQSANNEIQTITFDTIETARRFAAPDYSVTCVVVTYAEDFDVIPSNVVCGPFLQRTIADVATFAIPRPLPLLFDILTNGMEVSLQADSKAAPYIILSNADIHLQPFFYRAVAALIERGFDVITTNRRTIDVEPADRKFSPIFMADAGRDHPGFDCFVFPAQMAQQFVATEACCGAPHVMRSLLFNLVAQARRYLMLTQAQLTFHLGDDASWSHQKYADYPAYNIAAAQGLIRALVQNSEWAERLIPFISAHESQSMAKALPSTT